MAGNSAHGAGVVVVDLPTQDTFTPRTAFGWGDHLGGRLIFFLAQRLDINKPHRLQTEWAINLIPAVLVKTRTTHVFNQCTKQHEAEVAVQGTRARFIFGFFALDLGIDKVPRAL